MRAPACVSCWLLLCATALLGGVRAFTPLSASSSSSSSSSSGRQAAVEGGAALLRRGVVGSLRELNAQRCGGSSSSSYGSRYGSSDAAVSARLRDITMRMYTEPTRTAWTTPSKTAAAAANVAASITAAGGAPMIEKKRSTSGGATVLDRPAPMVAPLPADELPAPDDKFKVLLFNDSGNTREYVARVLVQVVGMPESDAFEIMTKAHKDGMALVGIWHLELAEAYCDQLKTRGLISEVFPVDSE